MWLLGYIAWYSVLARDAVLCEDARESGSCAAYLAFLLWDACQAKMLSGSGPITQTRN